MTKYKSHQRMSALRREVQRRQAFVSVGVWDLRRRVQQVQVTRVRVLRHELPHLADALPHFD